MLKNKRDKDSLLRKRLEELLKKKQRDFVLKKRRPRKN